MKIYELFEAGLTYMGYPCTKDCSGHQAGYNYAELYDVPDDECPYGNSNSFWEGCLSFTTPGDYEDEPQESVEKRLTKNPKDVKL